MQWTPGSTVSSVGHGALLVWLIMGWGFDSEPLPFDVSDVSIVTSEEYAAIVSATTPAPSENAPDAPVAPAVETAPDTPVAEPETAPPPPPDPVAPPAADAPPPPAPDALPVPPDTQAPVEPGPPQDEVVNAPNVSDSDRVIPRPSARVMAQPVAPPPPDAAPDEVVRQEAAPAPAPDAPVVEEAQEETAPEEAATEIVTEAEAPSGRVTETPRPPQRPNRPTPAPALEPETELAEETPEPEPEPAPQTDEDAIAAALAAAAAVEAPAEPALTPGPPMTGAEQEGFRVAVNACWNVDPGSQAAMVTMTVAFDLDQGGRVQGDVRQVGAMGGDANATEIAFQAARRAILRCQGQGGYDLPAEKYDQWKEVEITFDPSGMRLR
ncbi:hypothetical protein [Loktanella sp. SALINAS62]|uniref:hypothetical protein n=1 Tax=Loktanella sp. SALINAS62 TaxID=2706124 RepID=UPI001B8C9595|nr:hypothetical protein [Loktanella sp. SALINAS62]MBS1300852.1 hypothetical protein [Loktanella sp. SALINAS62]